MTAAETLVEALLAEEYPESYPSFSRGWNERTQKYEPSNPFEGPEPDLEPAWESECCHAEPAGAIDENHEGTCSACGDPALFVDVNKR